MKMKNAQFKAVPRTAGLTALIAVMVIALAGCPTEPDDKGGKPHVHDWGDWVTTDPACETAGVDTRTCKLDATHIEERNQVAALGHDWDDYVTTAPTCEEAGGDIRTCKRDATHIDIKDEVAALGHDWIGDWAFKTAATETVNGAETRKCSRDGSHEDSRPLWATGSARLEFVQENDALNVRKGSFAGTTLHIPAYYRLAVFGNDYDGYKPVTRVYDDGFRGTDITAVTFGLYPKKYTQLSSFH